MNEALPPQQSIQGIQENIDEIFSSFKALINAIRYLHQNIVSDADEIRAIGRVIDALEVICLSIDYLAAKYQSSIKER